MPAGALLVTGRKSAVVDPVVRSTSGYDLIDDDALKSLIKQLFPLSDVVTPNIPEAERITGMKIENEIDIRQAAKLMQDFGAKAVIIKGGHLPEPIDVLSRRTVDAAAVVDEFPGKRFAGKAVHGTGCAFASATLFCTGGMLPTIDDCCFSFGIT